MPFDFWTWEPTLERNKRDASDFMTLAREKMNQASAEGFLTYARDAMQQAADQFRVPELPQRPAYGPASAAAGMPEVSNAPESPPSSSSSQPLAGPSAIPQYGAQAAEAFKTWASDRLNDIGTGIAEAPSRLASAVAPPPMEESSPSPLQPPMAEPDDDPVGKTLAMLGQGASDLSQRATSTLNTAGAAIDDPVQKTMDLLGSAGGAIGSGYEKSEEFRKTLPQPLDILDQAGRKVRDVASTPGLAQTPLGVAARSIGEYGPTVAREMLPGLTEEGRSKMVASGERDAELSAKWREGTLSPDEEDERIRRLTDMGNAIGVNEPVVTRGAKVVAAKAGGGLIDGAKPIALNVEQEIKRLRLDKFAALPDEAQALLVRSSEGNDWWRQARRGVIPDDVAEQMADSLGKTYEQVIRSSKVGKSYSTEELRAMKNALAAQGMNVFELSKEITDAKASGVTPDLLIARLSAETQKLDALQKMFEGGRAEWGRAGRAFQSAARLIDLPPNEAVARIHKRFGGSDQMQEKLAQYTKLMETNPDPIQLAKYWANVENPPPGATDWFKALRYNSMLSGPRTFEINALGSLVEIPWRLARDTGISLARGESREVVSEVAGMWAGAQRGATAFMEVLANGISTEQALKGDLPRDIASRTSNPLARGVASALESTGRVMQGTDEFFHATAYGMQLGREAALQAKREGHTGKAWSKRVAELQLEPTPALKDRANKIADRMVFHGDLGAIGSGTEQWVRKAGILGHILVPFMRTSYHLSVRGLERTPIGLAGLGAEAFSKEGRDYLFRGAEKAGTASPQERLSEAIPGTLATLWLVGQAFEGKISAAGPEDKEKRQMLQAQGWQPYSMKIGDNWVSYANWGAFAMPLSLAAAVAEGQQYKAKDASGLDQSLDTMRRLSEVVTEQTYLKGIGGIYQAVKDPETYAIPQLTQLLTSIIPFGSAINTVGQMTDDVVRRPERGNVGQGIQARFPGLRENVPVATDVTGKPIANKQSGLGALNPLRVSPQSESAALKELGRLNIDLAVPKPEIAGKKLPFAEGKAYQDAAQTYRVATIAQLMNTPAYTSASDAEKEKMVRAAMTHSASWAGEQVAPQFVKDRELPYFNGDPDRASLAFVRALEGQQRLDALTGSKYLGVRGAAAERVAAQRSKLAAYRRALGAEAGDMAYISRYGARKYEQAISTPVDPQYQSRVDKIKAQYPEMQLFFGNSLEPEEFEAAQRVVGPAASARQLSRVS